jgi:hypothetical protein
MVAQTFPKLSACFEPAAQLARARVYFRVEGVEDWYFVEMTPDEACHAGILPKPQKQLVGKHIEYYIQATDQSFNTAQTEPHLVSIAESAAACATQAVATAVKAASVAVFPSMPAGFSASGGVSAAAVVGVAAGGTAVAAGTVVAISGDDDTPSTTSPSQQQSGGQGTAPTTTTTTTTTTTLATNEPPRGVFNVTPDPPKGPSPLKVKFNSCRSEDPDGDSLEFRFDFGDGARSSGECRVEHTYEVDRTTSFQAQACVTDGVPGHEVCHIFGVEAQVESSPTTTTYYVGPPAWLTLSSQLMVHGAHGQVILNHEHRSYPETGRAIDLRFPVRKRNIVEAQLVNAAGTSGLWRFELPIGVVEPGSLRAVAGQVETLEANTITFRLQGEPGERIVFVFRHVR